MEISKKTLVAFILITVVVTVPLAYSATEPSIIINMIFGQIEKPLIVKDNLGVEVFSVDVDGTVFPAPVSGAVTTVESLRHILIGEASQTTTSAIDIDGQVVLAKWRIDFNSLEDCGGDCGFNPLPPVLVTHFWISSFMKNDAGNFTILAISESFDDISYTEIFNDGDGSTTFKVTQFSNTSTNQKNCQRTNISQNQCFITMGFYVGQGTGSTSTMKDSIWEIAIILPADTTITKLI